MDPATTERLSHINQRILNAENERCECQQTLYAFLEHALAVFPELVEQRIQQLLNHIQTPEEEGSTFPKTRKNLLLGWTSASATDSTKIQSTLCSLRKSK